MAGGPTRRFQSQRWAAAPLPAPGRWWQRPAPRESPESRFLATLAALGVATIGLAQEAELPPIVVTGTFELAPRPSVTDLFTQHLLKQFETHRTLEEAVSRAPWYYSRIWGYAPMKLESSFDDS